jgi:hypothetical protein
MALEATHIRFALDIRDQYNVQDIEKYISGAIYPDSRYVTGIDRSLTHNDDIMLLEFAKDDFKKGWQAHQICDVVQGEILTDLLLDRDDDWDERRWIKISAVKIIQDMNDMKCFDLQSNLKYLEYAFNPNSENIDDIKKYNQIMIDLYKNKKETTIEDNYKMWIALGVDAGQGKKIKIKTEEFLSDNKLVKKIHSIYNKMLKRYREVLK